MESSKVKDIKNMEREKSVALAYYRNIVTKFVAFETKAWK